MSFPSSLACAAVLSLAVDARANDLAVVPSAAVVAPEETPQIKTRYLEFGGSAGSWGASQPDYAFFGALFVAGGYRLFSSIWAHGLVAAGKSTIIDDQVTGGSYLGARIGAEGRACTMAGSFCGFAGADVAVRHLSIEAEWGHVDLNPVSIVPRIGVDIGGSSVRIRPALELDVGKNGFDGLDLVLGISLLQ